MEVLIVTTDDIDFAGAQEYLSQVSSLRRSRIMKKRSEEDKLLALTAGLLVSSELSRRSGIPRERLRYAHGAFGKPYLIGSELQFSLSHTRGAVCAVFSDAGEVGADIERRDRRVGERLYSRVLSDRERLLVNSGEDFIRLWVQKEAFLKRLGTGIADDLRGADTTLLRDTVVREFGGYFVGISGAGSEQAEIHAMTFRELVQDM